MLTNWRKEILNYFAYPVTNGFAEGKNIASRRSFAPGMATET